MSICVLSQTSGKRLLFFARFRVLSRLEGSFDPTIEQLLDKVLEGNSNGIMTYQNSLESQLQPMFPTPGSPTPSHTASTRIGSQAKTIRKSSPEN